VLETPEGVPLRFELAGPGARVLAAALDALVFVTGFSLAVLVLSLVGFGFGGALLAAGFVLLLVGYAFGTALVLGGSTLGKRWTGIRVCDARGGAPSARQLFLRALFVPLEAALVLPVPLVWILIAATPRHQRLGDLVAGTFVLHARARRAPPEPVPGLRWSELERRSFALDPAAARALDGRDLGLLRELLTRAELAPSARERLHVEAATHYAERLGLGPRSLAPTEARTFLRELFLLVRELRAGGGAVPPVTKAAAAPATPPRVADGAADRGAPRGGGSPPR
jgi:uncharacterized RDD family membrane protein YckC